MLFCFLLLTNLHDLYQHSIQVRKYLLIRKPNHPQPSHFKVQRPTAIIGLSPVMTVAIQFDDQFPLHAEKVRDERPEGNLASELESMQLAILQLKPDATFGRRFAIPTQSSGELNLCIRGWQEMPEHSGIH